MELKFEKLEELKNSKPRKFKQSLELIIVLKDVDVKELKNKIQEVFVPYGINSKVIIFSETKKLDGIEHYTPKDIEKIASSAREARKFARKFDFALAEQKLLPLIGRLLGKYLAVRGKMPKPIIDEKSLAQQIEKLQKSVRINLKQNQIQLKIGKEDLEKDKVIQNIKEVLGQIIEKLPEGEKNIKKIYVKLTMSKPVKIYP
ncbi:MAG: 50S ribosomal protein L1 [Candidatus Aenigmatarchaeota archaeon]